MIIFLLILEEKNFTELAEVEVASEMAPRRIPKGMTPYQYETLYGGQFLEKLVKEAQ